MAKYTLKIDREDKTYELMPESEVVWETVRKSAPSKLTFTLPDTSFIPKEGDRVRFFADDKGIFLGYIFKVLTQKEKITVTCYDQLRYLKNKDNYIYQNKTASELLKMIAGDFLLKTDVIEDTVYRIPYRVEDSKTLFDIIETALDLTYENTGAEFVLYDNFGGLSLVNINTLQRNLLIDSTSFEDYSNLSSIDDSYNKIKLIHEDNRKKVRKIFLKEDKASQKKFGVLQYYSHISGNENGTLKATKLLSELNKVKKSLTLTGVKGDLSVFAGSKVYIDTSVYKGNMTVLKAAHNFSENAHTMTLSLKGGDIGE